METNKTFTINSTNRADIRKELITEFLEEDAGTGKGESCSVYYYFVETLQDGRRIYLKRPARLNKGFDFEVNVENTNFGVARRTTMPSHNSICDDLMTKKAENPDDFEKLEELIDKTYNCEYVSDLEMRSLNFNSGHSVELILKSIKWLFIEQDVTYWNWSGRNMLYKILPKT